MMKMINYFIFSSAKLFAKNPVSSIGRGGFQYLPLFYHSGKRRLSGRMETENRVFDRLGSLFGKR